MRLGIGGTLQERLLRGLDFEHDRDHARRNTGNRRRMVSSSKSQTASGGRCVNCRTIAPFFAPDVEASRSKSSAVVYTLTPAASSDGGASRAQ